MEVSKFNVKRKFTGWAQYYKGCKSYFMLARLKKAQLHLWYNYCYNTDIYSIDSGEYRYNEPKRK